VSDHIDIKNIEARTHGRVLVRAALGRDAGVLIGFHGYYENADVQMTRLREIPGAAAWTLVCPQGLHRFYRARTEDVVASWMTRQDRELAIEDNVAYINTVVASVAEPTASTAIVCVGFSQGVAMAFRAGVRGRVPCTAVIGVGGDVPPEIRDDPAVAWPPVLFIRGSRDEWYTQAKLDADLDALRMHGADARGVVVDAPHDWTADVSREAGQFLGRFKA
jgi:predicted esterase